MELQLVGLVAQGLSNKDLALTTGKSENAIKQRLSRAYLVLGVVNRTQAAAWYLKTFPQENQ